MTNRIFIYCLFALIYVLVMPAVTCAQRYTEAVSRFITDSAETTVFTDVKIIDGTGGASKSHQSLVISLGKIISVGSLKETIIPTNAKVINCTGKTMIPGLVMLHEHLYYTMMPENGFNVAEMPYSFAPMYLAGGATTIRTGGSIEPQTDLNIKQLIKEGKMVGPDMDVTAPYIERKAWDIPSMNIIKDSAEAAANVRFWADRGCTSFKMYVHATKEDLIAVAREAHQRNLKVTGHIGTITYREAAELGIDNLEHGFFASSDFDAAKKENELDYRRAEKSLAATDVHSPAMKALMELLIKKKVAITSTLPVFEPATGREIVLGGGCEALAPQVKERVISWWNDDNGKDSVSLTMFKKDMVWEKQFYDMGGLLVCGTDPTGSGRTLPGYGSRREIELLVEAGFTPLQAIKIATLNGAVYLGRANTIGTIEAGKNADLVLIDGDPESNINDIRKTETVFKNGVGFDSKKIFNSVKGYVGLY